MAAQGKNAVYRQAKPLQGDISTDIKYWNEDGARRRKEAVDAEQEEYNREQTKRAEKKALYDKYIKPYNNTDSGSKSLNEFQGRALQMALSQIPEQIEILENNDIGSDAYLKAQLKLEGLSATPERIAKSAAAAMERNKVIEQGIANGTIKENEKVQKYRKALQNGYESFRPGFDEQGMFHIAYVDKDGDGENDLLGVESYDSIIKGLSDFQFDRNIDADKLAVQAVKELGKDTKVTDSNYKKTTVEGPLNTSVEAKAKSLMLSPDGGSFSEAGKSLAIDMGLDLKDPKSLDTVVTAFKEKMEPNISRTDKEDMDYGAKTSANRLYLDNQKNDETPTPSYDPVTPTREVYRTQFYNIDSNEYNSIDVGGIPLPPVKDINGNTITGGKALNYTVNKQNKIVLDVEVPVTSKSTTKDFTEIDALYKSGEIDKEQYNQAVEQGELVYNVTKPGESTRKVVVLNPSDEARFAKSLGGIKAAKDRARKKKEVKPKNKNQKVDEYGVPIN